MLNSRWNSSRCRITSAAEGQSFAARSEAFNVEQNSVLEETIDADLAALQAELDKVRPDDQSKGEKKQPKRQTLPAHLPRREVRHEPENTA